jgi:cyclopropane fatty-acyl-phospholipid synthase-like methyltransferase
VSEATHFSPTEQHGLAAVPDDARQIFSVGISTGGIAEMRMAETHPQAHIVATTLDVAGLEQAQAMINDAGLSQQIESKIEDVSEPLPYADGEFDFIYARLVLHYLSKQTLPPTLRELHRVLKPGHQLFVVVRSVDCPDNSSEGAKYDEQTGLTTYTHPVKFGGEIFAKRYFHTEDSIRAHVEDASFTVEYVRSLNERLFADFMRTKISPHTDNLIELMATK